MDSTLPGLLYKPKVSKKVAIHLHGNGSTSVFYHDDRRDELARALGKKGISLLLFNNRGANYIKKLHFKKKGRLQSRRFGMAYEKIKECIEDIDGAIKLLEKQGYKEFYLLGESTGANKICVYDSYKLKNKVSKYVLIGGGDDTGLYYHMLGKKRFFKLLGEAKKKIKKRKGDEIIKELLPQLFSYTGFYDIVNPDGNYNIFPFYEIIRKVRLSKKPLFRHFRSIKKPTLVIYGEKDEYAWGNVPKIVDILKGRRPDFEYKIIKGADHALSAHHKKLAQILSSWLP